MFPTRALPLLRGPLRHRIPPEDPQLARYSSPGPGLVPKLEPELHPHRTQTASLLGDKEDSQLSGTEGGGSGTGRDKRSSQPHPSHGRGANQSISWGGKRYQKGDEARNRAYKVLGMVPRGLGC